MKYPNSVYQNNDPILYQPVDTTSATFVDTLEGVLEMLAELKTASEIAVDLEHHDTRSFVGLTSLMQISTRNRDWIVDTLKPWRQELQVLNEVFADPNIIKVSLSNLPKMFELLEDCDHTSILQISEKVNSRSERQNGSLVTVFAIASHRRYCTYMSGFPRRVYGYRLAPAGSRPLHCRIIRHSSCKSDSWLPRRQPGLFAQKVYRF